MATILLKGKLAKWADDKGFGFIRPRKRIRKIFVHMSSFDGALSRRPKVGDTIYYLIHTDTDGMTKAVEAKIKGVTLQHKTFASRPAKHDRERGLRNNWGVLVLCSALLLGIGGSIYYRLPFSGGLSIASGMRPSNTFITSLTPTNGTLLTTPLRDINPFAKLFHAKEQEKADL